MAYNIEQRQNARNLFVESGLSYKEIAHKSGVSVNNLKRWGISGKWMSQRREFQGAHESRGKKIQRLEDLIIDALIAALENNNLHSQDAYALAATWRSLLLYGIVNESPHLVKVVERLERILGFSEKLKAIGRK